MTDGQVLATTCMHMSNVTSDLSKNVMTLANKECYL